MTTTPMGDFSPLQILDTVLRRRWVLIAVFTLVMVAGIVAAVKIPKTYEANTLILVEPPRVPTNVVQPVLTTDISAQIATLSQQIMSRSNIEKIIREYSLFSGPGASPLFPEDRLKIMRERITIQVSPPMPGRGRGETTSSSFTIKYKDSTPQIAMQVTNALASHFINENLKSREEQVLGTSDFLDDELKAMRKRLEGVEDGLKRFREQHMGELPEQLDSNLSIIERLQQQLTDRETSLRDAKNRLAVLKQTPPEPVIVIPQQAGESPAREESNDPEIVRTRLSALRARYTDQHPDVIRLQKRLTDLETERSLQPASGSSPEPVVAPPRSAQAAAVLTQQAEARLEIQKLEMECAEIRAQINLYRRRVENTPKVEQELLSLQRGYQDIQTAYSAMLNRKMDAEVAVNMERKQKGEQFRVLDLATLPQRPVSPDMNRLFLIVVAASLGVGAGIVFLLEYLDSSFRRPEDVKALLELPILATIAPIAGTRDKIFKRLNQASSIVALLVSVGLCLVFAAVTVMGSEIVINAVRSFGM